MAERDNQRRLAVLIDADNVQAKVLEAVLSEVANLGIASVKRIYGDWTKPELKSWKELLLQHSVQPIQQFAYTRGKNATDSALIIDAMDLLYTNRLDGFCIVSSDSDYTKLISRLRESGMIVYGFGEKKTPEPFVAACDRFIYTENLRGDDEDEKQVRRKRYSPAELRQDSKLVFLLRSAVEDSADDDGWANLGIVGQNLLNRKPDFDPRTYGYKKLSEIFHTIALFDSESRTNPNGNGKTAFLRDKRNS